MGYEQLIVRGKPLSYYLKSFILVVIMYITTIYVLYLLGEVHRVTLNYQDEPINVIDDKFLSYGIDTAKLTKGADKSQIDTMRKNIDGIRGDVPMWLSETSSAYGGGAPGLSDSYAATPLWIDKLGVSALKGIDVVVRQSLIGGSYSLLSDDFKPHPDWWVSLLFKRLVGNQVLNITVEAGQMQRLYCHCSASGIRKNGSVTIYGSNLSHVSTRLRLWGGVFNDNMTIEEYVILPKDGNRMSQDVTLNGELLEYKGEVPELSPKIYVNKTTVYMPSYSVAFWVIHGVKMPLCY